MSAPRRYRLALSALLVIGLLASLYVALVREGKERAARRVEIAMDETDFADFARSNGYDQERLLIALRRAGLTSLAVSEQLGGDVNASPGAAVYSGQNLIDQAKLTGLAEPTLARLARRGALSARDLYLIVRDPSDVTRFLVELRAHVGAHAVRVVRPARPTIIAVRTQLDYFNALGLGLPAGPLALARTVHLYLDPRIQNDERYGPTAIARIFRAVERHERPATMIFFGQRNEVLGYPDHLADAAAAFDRSGLNFGAIEVYSDSQIQRGTEGLARLAIARTTRVQAISKLELDKLKPEEIVARYLLGVRERNIRVVYLRPYLHGVAGGSLEATNVAIVRAIADGLRARGFLLGRASPIAGFRFNPLLIGLVSLAVPAIYVLLFEAFGLRRPRLVYALVALDLALLGAGYLVGGDLAVRKLLALFAAIGFAVMGVVAIPRAFTSAPPASYGGALLAGLRTLGLATAFALGGALVVVGLLSVPLLMEEIERFEGVKLVFAVPPLVAFLLYVYTRRFGREPPQFGASLRSPIRLGALVALIVIALGAVVYISRTGNQSDIAPTPFELALRSDLAAVLGVRPRFKEFLIGFPLMMLLPALRLERKRVAGWAFAIGIAIGTSDVVDTFSHLHTPLEVSLLRVFNGAVIGIVLGALAIALYRLIEARLAVRDERRSTRAA
ncbi:MAG: DUF5693 family protein [Vulcanimicrobiaceae bacterium]